jgi:hypothetical protein
LLVRRVERVASFRLGVYNTRDDLARWSPSNYPIRSGGTVFSRDSYRTRSRSRESS